MSGENTGSFGRGGRGDVLYKFRDVVPGPGSYFSQVGTRQNSMTRLKQIDEQQQTKVSKKSLRTLNSRKKESKGAADKTVSRDHNYRQVASSGRGKKSTKSPANVHDRSVGDHSRQPSKEDGYSRGGTSKEGSREASWEQRSFANKNDASQRQVRGVKSLQSLLQLVPQGSGQMQTTPAASQRIVTTVFGLDPRNTMITNENMNRIGPGPAAYDHLRSLKKVVGQQTKGGPIIRQPSDLHERVKRKLNVSSSEDLFKQKLVKPGPGSYNPDNSQMSNRGQPFQQINETTNSKRVKQGISIPKDVSERCIFEEGETYSPGPAQYSTARAAQKMQIASWVKKNSTSNFNRAKRSIDLEDRSMNDRQSLPGPGQYTNLKEVLLSKQQSNTGSIFPKQVRKTVFDEAGQRVKPGPGDYERKRMFDNKQAIDYSKRFGQSSVMSQGYNTTLGFSNDQGLGGQSSTLRGGPTGQRLKPADQIVEERTKSQRSGIQKQKSHLPKEMDFSGPKLLTQQDFNYPSSKTRHQSPSESLGQVNVLYGVDPFSNVNKSSKKRRKKSKKKLLQQSQHTIQTQPETFQMPKSISHMHQAHEKSVHSLSKKGQSELIASLAQQMYLEKVQMSPKILNKRTGHQDSRLRLHNLTSSPTQLSPTHHMQINQHKHKSSNLSIRRKQRKGYDSAMKLRSETASMMQPSTYVTTAPSIPHQQALPQIKKSLHKNMRGDAKIKKKLAKMSRVEQPAVRSMLRQEGVSTPLIPRLSIDQIVSMTGPSTEQGNPIQGQGNQARPSAPEMDPRTQGSLEEGGVNGQRFRPLATGMRKKQTERERVADKISLPMVNASTEPTSQTQESRMGTQRSLFSQQYSQVKKNDKAQKQQQPEQVIVENEITIQSQKSGKVNDKKGSGTTPKFSAGTNSKTMKVASELAISEDLALQAPMPDGTAFFGSVELE